MALPMFPYFGHLAALATSACWSGSSVFFTLSGRLVGAVAVNRLRLILAVLFVMITHCLLQGQLLPLDAEPFRWGWLALSGLLGYVIGDSFLFQAYVLIGPRLGMLLMSTHPVFGTILAWALLNEQLSGLELLGIALSVSGVALVVSDRQNGPASGDQAAPRVDRRTYILGILCGLGAAFGQASGLLASKLGLVDGFPAISGNLIRLLAAMAAIWIITAVRREVRATVTRLRANPRAVRYVFGGAAVGPFLGVWLSLVAVQLAPLGVASTLMALSPIFLLPVGRVLFRERIGVRAVLGTGVAIVGAAILFL
jgi:drug/metabolite transporter (DMT)-like permease